MFDVTDLSSATTADFSKGFAKYFFWVCILWILIASTLLVFIVRHFGANSRDAMSAFLASVAIWAPLAAAVGRLQALDISVRFTLLQSGRKVSAGGAQTFYSLPRAWAGEAEVYRAMLESVARERLCMAAHQRLGICATFPPVPVAAMSYNRH